MILGVLFLVGCTVSKTIEDEQSKLVEQPESTENTLEEDSQETVENVEQHLSLEGYEEYDRLVEKIDLAVYQAELTTDNPGKRILLFADTIGNKMYKSIYIKRDGHLKIIQLDDEGLLFNGQVN